MKRNGLKGRSARKGAFSRKVMRIWRCDILDYTLDCGPVAQLGARFHGMEEVDGSNPSRSTTTFQTLTALLQPRTQSPESKWSPNPVSAMGTLGHRVDCSACPRIAL